MVENIKYILLRNIFYKINELFRSIVKIKSCLNLSLIMHISVCQDSFNLI